MEGTESNARPSLDTQDAAVAGWRVCLDTWHRPMKLQDDDMLLIDGVRRGDGEDIRAVDASGVAHDISGTTASFGDIRLHLKKRVGKFVCLIHTTGLPILAGNQNENLPTAAAEHCMEKSITNTIINLIDGGRSRSANDGLT